MKMVQNRRQFVKFADVFVPEKFHGFMIDFNYLKLYRYKKEWQ